MIKSIKIHEATFSVPQQFEPLQVNLLYGNNGTGKSTIAQIIERCGVELTWESHPLRVLVFNNDFINSNFYQSKELQGIFTLGEQNADAQEKIDSLEIELREQRRRYKEIRQSIDKMESELKAIMSQIIENCWQYKRKHDSAFKKAFTGFGTKVKFAEKCLVNIESLNNESVQNYENLLEQYALAFTTERRHYSQKHVISLEQLQIVETSSLLENPIVGSENAPIGKLISKLKNSGWVHQGKVQLFHSEGKCPFCQQVLADNFADELTAFFDTEYERDVESLKQFAERYKTFVDKLFGLREFMVSDLPITVSETLIANIKSTYQSIEIAFRGNLEALKTKIASPSKSVSLVSLVDMATSINESVIQINRAIEENNRIASNHSASQKQCVNAVWDFIGHEAKRSISSLLEQKNDYDLKLREMKDELDSLVSTGKSLSEEQRLLQRSVTSILPTIEEMNELLMRFSFEGFKFTESPVRKGFYQLVRENGDPVNNTLSEGELNFTAFLYFYHLVHGAYNSTHINEDRVIVIDDPVTALDDSSSYVASGLTKEIIEICLQSKAGIRQVFVMTHSSSYFTEITRAEFRRMPRHDAIQMWEVKKKNNVSTLVQKT